MDNVSTLSHAIDEPRHLPGRHLSPRQNTRILFLAVVLLCVSIGFIYHVGVVAIQANREMAVVLVDLQDLEDFTAALTDAETGQRGYLLTGEDTYLEPYQDGLSRIQSDVNALRQMVSSGNLPRDNVEQALALTRQRLAELSQTIEVRRTNGLEAVLVMVRTNHGEHLMDRVRDEIFVMVAAKEAEFAAATRRADRTTTIRNLTFLGVGLMNVFVLLWAARTITREAIRRSAAIAEVNRQKELLSVTLKSIGDGVVATDCHGNITFMNPVAENLLGVRQQDVSGQRLADLFKIVNESTRQPVENPIDRVLREGRVVGLGNHTILVSRAGAEMPIDDSAAPIREPNGEMIGVVLVFRDASKERSAEFTARRLAAIVEHSGDAIYSADLDGMITSWNQSAERMFGYRGEEVIGKPISILIPSGNPNEEPKILDRIRQGERVAHYETTRRRKDGTDVNVSLTISLLKEPASGRTIGVSKIARDITERLEAEKAVQEAAERYRTLFDSMDEGFCVLQMIFDAEERPVDYCFVETNPAFTKQTGLENVVGKRMREIAPRLEKHWFDIYGKVALTGEPIRFENEARALDRWFDVYAYRVGWPEERKVAVLFTDITTRKKSDQALAKAQGELEGYTRDLEHLVAERTGHLQQTIADLEAFSYTVSHDLRSPLRAMQGFAQMLITGYAEKLDEQGRNFLQRISNSAVRMDKLILEVLTYSRVGRGDLIARPIDLEKLIEEVTSTYPSIRESGAEIRVDHPLKPVIGSHASLVQCVSNLLTNAVKFVPGGSKPRVHIWTEQHESTVRFSVEDNGIGIPPNLQSRIFEPFQRAHPEAGYEGTGMGLAIVRKAMQRMGGTVGVDSEENHGSIFWIELPAAA